MLKNFYTIWNGSAIHLGLFFSFLLLSFVIIYLFRSGACGANPSYYDGQSIRKKRVEPSGVNSEYLYFIATGRLSPVPGQRRGPKKRYIFEKGVLLYELEPNSYSRERERPLSGQHIYGEFEETLRKDFKTRTGDVRSEQEDQGKALVTTR